MPDAKRDTVIAHDPAWLLAQCDTPDKGVLHLANADGRVVALFVHDGVLDLVFGELSVGRRRVRRHVLVGNFKGFTPADWEAIFACLRQALPRRAALFLLGVVEGEALDEALQGAVIARSFHILPHGPAYERRICRIGADLKAYLAGLPAGRRQDLRRSLRRFEQAFEGRFSFQLATRVDEVVAFLETIEPVSARTYQARLRGLGITRDGHIGRMTIEGARLGYARCYLLTIDGRPVAWRIGFLYGDTFFSHHVGYDPAYDTWHPGVVMHLHTVADLAAQNGRVAWLDMLYGDNAFKRKAASLSRRERNVYLFPRDAHGMISATLLAGVNTASDWAGRLLDRYGGKEAIRRWLRRSARPD